MFGDLFCKKINSYFFLTTITKVCMLQVLNGCFERTLDPVINFVLNEARFFCYCFTPWQILLTHRFNSLLFDVVIHDFV